MIPEQAKVGSLAKLLMKQLELYETDEDIERRGGTRSEEDEMEEDPEDETL